jgi:CheY-like chemotaxis protein
MNLEKYTIRVLLAEDKEYMQELVKKYVLSNPNRCVHGVNVDYEIDIKSNAQDAILKYVSLEHDIVIMDLLFDGYELTGIDATSELLQVAPNLSIIGIASETDGKLEEFQRSGIRFFLEKPFQDGYLWSRMDVITDEVIARELAKPEPVKKGLFKKK